MEQVKIPRIVCDNCGIDLDQNGEPLGRPRLGSANIITLCKKCKPLVKSEVMKLFMMDVANVDKDGNEIPKEPKTKPKRYTMDDIYGQVCAQRSETQELISELEQEGRIAVSLKTPYGNVWVRTDNSRPDEVIVDKAGALLSEAKDEAEKIREERDMWKKREEEVEKENRVLKEQLMELSAPDGMPKEATGEVPSTTDPVAEAGK